MNRWRVETQILAGFALAVIVLATVGIGLYRATQAFIATGAELDRSLRAAQTLETIYSLLNQAESRQRAWLLLHDDVDLQARAQALAGLDRMLDELLHRVADKPALRARLPELREIIGIRLEQLQAVLETDRIEDLQAARQQLRSSIGRGEMEHVHALITAMRDELDRDITAQHRASRRDANRSLSLLGLLLFAVVLVLAVLYVRIRRETGERLASEERLQAVVETAGDGIITVDARGVIETFNAASERLFGYQAGEIIGTHISQLIAERGQGLFDASFQAPSEANGPSLVEAHETTARRKDGSEMPIALSIGRMRLGGEAHLTGIIHDLSRRRQAETQQQELIAELRAANEELENFAYVVSHDLKAPLRGISSLADWLLEDHAAGLDDQGLEYLSLMKNRAVRMDALIDGILEYSRIGHGAAVHEPVDLSTLLARVLQLVAPPPDVQIKLDSILPIVPGEPTRLQQVLQNLIVNAIVHRDKPQCMIRIYCTDLGDRWRISVEDNGPGIEARHQDRIFQLFQVLTPRDRKEGSGVGLALVRKIIELHGGQVWVESLPGNGATFHFTLPKQDNAGKWKEDRA